MASRLTFGIDPGLTGAIVTLLDGEPGPMVDMPVMDGRSTLARSQRSSGSRGTLTLAR